MNYAAAADVYRQNAVENAPPIKIVRLLYEGALRFVAKAMTCDPNDPGSEFIEYASRAEAIVSELRLSLDHSLGDGVTENLEQLYLFCEGEFARALVERSVEPLDSVKRVLTTLLDGWKQVETDTLRTG